MKNDNDFVMRQVKKFAVGIAHIDGKGKTGETEIVFDQQQDQKNNFERETKYFLSKGRFREALSYFYDLKFEIEPDEYLRIGKKLLSNLKNDSRCYIKLINKLQERLNRLQKGNTKS